MRGLSPRRDGTFGPPHITHITHAHNLRGLGMTTGPPSAPLQADIAVSDTEGWELWKRAPELYVTPGGASPLLDLWARAEGNWEAIRTGEAKVSPPPRPRLPPPARRRRPPSTHTRLSRAT